MSTPSREDRDRAKHRDAARVRQELREHLTATPTVAGFVKFIEDERWHNFPVSLADFKALAHRYVESLAPTQRDP